MISQEAIAVQITAKTVNAAREVSGLGILEVRRALDIAAQRFDGDVLMGFGYVERSALAVHRLDPERQLEKEAASWAEARRKSPAWMSLTLMMADDKPATDTTPVHVLHRIRPEFDALAVGAKLHELARNGDRAYCQGDDLEVREVDDASAPTGRCLQFTIGYVTSADIPCALSNGALHPDYSIISLAPR